MEGVVWIGAAVRESVGGFGFEEAEARWSARVRTCNSPKISTTYQHIMPRPMPTPGPIRAIRLSADGSSPHLLTLETIIADPSPRPSNAHLGYYRVMLEYLLDNDPVCHVPNVPVFWSPRAWELRDVVKFRYLCKSKPDLNGRYTLLMTNAKEDLKANPYLSNEKFDSFGDAFVLKEVGYKWLLGADLDDVMGCLLELRHGHEFPQYENVPEGILNSGLLEVVRRDCFKEDVCPCKQLPELLCSYG